MGGVVSRISPFSAAATEDSTYRTALLVTTVSAALLAFVRLAWRPTSRPQESRAMTQLSAAADPNILPSPLRTFIPTLSAAELAALDYRPDEFPGARDVDTPYGSIRVYEFGPESGPKLLCIHGISTTCQTLGPLATALARRHGFRVMLFDLFGRGFSDCPRDLPHDARLYTAQALLALASSPLAWTGPTPIRVLGYSLGGALAVHLVNALPARLVESVALLAPAGVVRAERFGAVNRFVFTSGCVPERLLAVMTRQRLKRPLAEAVKRPKRGAPASSSSLSSSSSVSPSPSPPSLPSPRASSDEASSSVLVLDDHGHTDDPVRAALSETTRDPSDPSTAATPPLEQKVLRYVQWMVAHHPGFVPAFTSCLRHAPLTDQQPAYARLGRSSSAAAAVSGAAPATRVGIVFGDADELVSFDDFATDALPLLGGPENVFLRVVPGGHDFVMTHQAQTLAALEEFWGLR